MREKFFSRLKVMFYAGASLPQHVRNELEQLAAETTGERIIFLSSLGSTETAPSALFCSWDSEHAGNIGLPLPGVTLKLVPRDGKLEARLKGPIITPGYWRAPALTEAAFDEEGFYKIGDALKFEDPDDWTKGLHLRRAHRRGFQARDRHLGQCRTVALGVSLRIARRWCATSCWPGRIATTSRP